MRCVHGLHPNRANRCNFAIIVHGLGLSLTIPLAMVVDFLVHHHTFSVAYFFGSALVVCGFVLVNWQYRHDADSSPSSPRATVTALPPPAQSALASIESELDLNYSLADADEGAHIVTAQMYEDDESM